MRSISDERFVEAWKQGGSSPQAVADILGLDIRSVYKRRAEMSQRGMVLQSIPIANRNGVNAFGGSGWQMEPTPYRQRVDFTVKDGYAVFFGDAHWWPGQLSIANRALLAILPSLKPQLVCANGDVFDGATVSRHEPLGWVKLPKVIEELDTVKLRLDEIKRAASKKNKDVKLFLSPGNHCTRFDRRLATEVPEFEGVFGFRIEDHLKDWQMAYVGVINKDADVPVVVMHNYKGGVHATWNNTIHTGATIVTGHLHAQDIKAHTDYFNTKYGVDHGVLQDPKHAAFSYTMGRPSNWRSGFAVIRFDAEGRHYPPELCTVQAYDGYKRAVWRGEEILSEQV
jgi:hypothetical protein